MERKEVVKRHTPGKPPEGFNNPPPVIGASGIISLPDNPEPSVEPDINEPEPATDIHDIGGGEPEIPVEIDIPEPDPVPDVDPPVDIVTSQDNDQDIGDQGPPNDDEERPEDFD